MHNNTEITRMLDKLDELRSIFVLGQRAIPFIEEVVNLIRDLAPVLESINGSLQDSASKLPSASSQLERVSQATENATTEILNLVDLALITCGELGKSVDTVSTFTARLEQLDAQIWPSIEERIGPEAWAAVQPLYVEYADSRGAMFAGIQKGLSGQHQAIDTLKDGVRQITLSLQVQDITSQQIASVNHLIHSTRERLHKLTQNLGMKPANPVNDTKLASGETFDSNARYELPGLRELAPRDRAAFGSNGDLATLGDIDKLFASQ